MEVTQCYQEVKNAHRLAWGRSGRGKRVAQRGYKGGKQEVNGLHDVRDQLKASE